VHGLRLALAAWNSGAPGAATWNVSCSCFASSSLRALAQPYLNCSRLSVTARFQFAGFRSTGEADRNDEVGSGSTPRKGAGSIAMVKAAAALLVPERAVGRSARLEPRDCAD